MSHSNFVKIILLRTFLQNSFEADKKNENRIKIYGFSHMLWGNMLLVTPVLIINTP